jgi:hypothetical protein
MGQQGLGAGLGRFSACNLCYKREGPAVDCEEAGMCPVETLARDEDQD